MPGQSGCNHHLGGLRSDLSFAGFALPLLVCPLIRAIHAWSHAGSRLNVREPPTRSSHASSSTSAARLPPAGGPVGSWHATPTTVTSTPSSRAHNKSYTKRQPVLPGGMATGDTARKKQSGHSASSVEGSSARLVVSSHECAVFECPVVCHGSRSGHAVCRRESSCGGVRERDRVASPVRVLSPVKASTRVESGPSSEYSEYSAVEGTTQSTLSSDSIK